MTEPLHPKYFVTGEALASIVQSSRTMYETLFRLPIVRTFYVRPEQTAALTLVVEGNAWLSTHAIYVRAHPYLEMNKFLMVTGTPPPLPEPDPVAWHPDLMDAEANAAYWSAE